MSANVGHLDEVCAYALGHLAACRFHAIPFALIEAPLSLKPDQNIVLAVAAAAGGAYVVYRKVTE